MSEDELKAWFDQISADVEREGLQVGNGYSQSATRFLPAAESAIRAAFPAEHPLCQQWMSASSRVHIGSAGQRGDAYSLLLGIFDSAHDQLKTGRRGSFTSIVRSAAENDLLGVADELLDANFPSAAAGVVAGGALEIHLRGLCERQAVKWEGKDQIENYKAALERAHKAKPSNGINTTDGKLVTAWGGLRNDAAHKPDEFTKKRKPEEVRAMISGIREFIARTT